jgi:UDP-glucose 4-epimerase
MILVTGGLGYLGSHIALELISKGQEVVLVDNLSQSSMQILERLEYNTNLYIPFIRLDVRNTPILQKVFEQYPIDYVVHTAGFKSLTESVQRPLDYYNNNLSCLMSVLRIMQRSGIRRLVNLSSIMVYAKSGEDFKEDAALNFSFANPYIRAQQQNEQILSDVFASDDYWQILNLRLSNVVGAYHQAKLGEWSSPLPKSLLLNLLLVASGQREVFDLYQPALHTADGSSERDFIHIMDVVEAIYQLMLWSETQASFLQHFNLCTGRLSSVLQMIKIVENVTGTKITYQGYPEASAELAQLSADPSKLQRTLNWQAERSVSQAVAEQWQFQQSRALK